MQLKFFSVILHPYKNFFENNDLMANNGEGIIQEIENDKIDIVEKLKTLSKKYIAKDVAQKTIECIFDENNINNMFNDDIKLIYDIKIEKHNDYNIDNINKLYNEIEKIKNIFLLILNINKRLILLQSGFQKEKSI